MGVWCLKTFIDSDKKITQDVCVTIDLQEIAEQCREIGRKAVIVVDLHNISRRFKHDYDFISGGEYKSIAQNTENFIAAFKAIGFELVFFFAGGTEEMAMIKSKRFEKLKTKREIEQYFNIIEEVPILRHANKHIPPFLSRVVKDAAKRHCQVVRVRENRDKEMVEYVITNGCLGILTDDTDLLVYDRVPHVLSGHDLNMDDFTTIEYRREAVLEVLDLPGDAMPIFSTLMGNDIVIRQDTMAYHYRTFGTKNPQINKKVSVLAERAKFIYEESGGDTEQAADLLTEEMFISSVDRLSQRDRLLRSLLGYETFTDGPEHTVEGADMSNWDKIVALCKQTYPEIRPGQKSVTVIDRQFFRVRAYLEDSGLCISEALVGLRKRLYSVLLFEKNFSREDEEANENQNIPPKNFVEEIFSSGRRNPFIKYLVSTVPITVEHPGLLRLWGDEEALDNIRWRLLLWILSTDNKECDLNLNEEISVFRQAFFQDHFGLVGLALLFLYQVLKLLSEKELTVLIVMTASVPEMNATDLKERSVEYTTKRAVSISTLFQQTCYAIRWALKALKFKLNVNTCDLYSGLLFHYLFQQDDPTEFLFKLPSQAMENYVALRSALNECCA